MTDPTPDETLDEQVEQKVKEFLGTLVWNWVWVRVRTWVAPVIASVLVTQGGAALFVPDHVKTAVASEVTPAKTKADKLEKGTGEAYHVLASVVNSQGKILHGKASSEDVKRLRVIIETLQDELDDHVVMLDALQQFVRVRHGDGAFQRQLDAVEVVPEETAPVLVQKPLPPVPLVTENFGDFLKGKEDQDAGDPNDRED